jgi:hypothetical protein
MIIVAAFASLSCEERRGCEEARAVAGRELRDVLVDAAE